MEALRATAPRQMAFLYSFLRYADETFCGLQKLWTVLGTVALLCDFLVSVVSRVLAGAPRMRSHM